MDWSRLLENLVSNADDREYKKAQGYIEEIRGMIDEHWKKVIMDMLVEAVERHGLEGIKKVRETFEQMVNGENPDMSYLNLRSRSDALAIMQNAEADRKKKVNDFLVVIGEALGKILKFVIKGLLKG